MYKVVRYVNNLPHVVEQLGSHPKDEAMQMAQEQSLGGKWGGHATYVTGPDGYSCGCFRNGKAIYQH